jgi:uncharacterized protein (DUF433 family)
MTMTETEIKYRYKTMARTHDRAQILAELNDCEKHDIEAILGHKAERRINIIFDETDREDIVKLYEAGMSMKQIGRWFHCHANTIKSVLVDRKVRIRT